MRTNPAVVFRYLSRSALAVVLVFAMNNIGYAFPSLGADCASCHNDVTGGNVEVTPDPVSLLLGDTGSFTLDVTELPTGGALSINGLQDSGLDASVTTAGWNEQPDGRWTMGGITSTGPLVVDFATGGSVTGHYDIEVFLAGGQSGEQWAASTSFVISAIPEPASIALLAAIGGAFGAGRLVRRRRKGTFAQN